MFIELVIKLYPDRPLSGPIEQPNSCIIIHIDNNIQIIYAYNNSIQYTLNMYVVKSILIIMMPYAYAYALCPSFG